MEKGEEDFLVENQDLIGGINSALSRCQTLKQAMMALYNAGYEKTKIEEAARAYIELSKNPSKIPSKINKVSKLSKIPKEKVRKKGFLDKAIEMKKPVIAPSINSSKSKDVVKDVSIYEPKEKKISTKAHQNSNLITFLLIFVLVILLLILGSVFLFKNELVDFFNRMFG